MEASTLCGELYQKEQERGDPPAWILVGCAGDAMSLPSWEASAAGTCCSLLLFLIFQCMLKLLLDRRRLPFAGA